MPCARSMFDRYCKDAELNGKHRIDVKLVFYCTQRYWKNATVIIVQKFINYATIL